MSALYGWITSDTRRRSPATSGGNRYMHLKVAYERGGADWRTITDNEVTMVAHFPEGADVPTVRVTHPEEVKVMLSRNLGTALVTDFPVITLNRRDVQEVVGEDIHLDHDDLEEIARLARKGLMDCFWHVLGQAIEEVLK